MRDVNFDSHVKRHLLELENKDYFINELQKELNQEKIKINKDYLEGKMSREVRRNNMRSCSNRMAYIG